MNQQEQQEQQQRQQEQEQQQEQEEQGQQEQREQEQQKQQPLHVQSSAPQQGATDSTSATAVPAPTGTSAAAPATSAAQLNATTPLSTASPGTPAAQASAQLQQSPNTLPTPYGMLCWPSLPGVQQQATAGAPGLQHQQAVGVAPPNIQQGGLVVGRGILSGMQGSGLPLGLLPPPPPGAVAAAAAAAAAAGVGGGGGAAGMPVDENAKARRKRAKNEGPVYQKVGTPVRACVRGCFQSQFFAVQSTAHRCRLLYSRRYRVV